MQTDAQKQLQPEAICRPVWLTSGVGLVSGPGIPEPPHLRDAENNVETAIATVGLIASAEVGLTIQVGGVDAPLGAPKTFAT